MAEPVVAGCVALVLVTGGGSGPGSCPALRLLAGQPMLRYAVAALTGSGRVREIVVTAPAETIPEVQAALAGTGARCAPDAGPALAGLPDDAIVVVHDPQYPLAPADLAGTVLDLLRQRPPGAAAAGPWSGAVPVLPVTDTLKSVDARGIITGTVDREGFRLVASPQAYRVGALRAALEARESPGGASLPGADQLPDRIRSQGGRVLTVPAPATAFRVADDEGLEHAEAVLRAPQTGPDRPDRPDQPDAGRAQGSW